MHPMQPMQPMQPRMRRSNNNFRVSGYKGYSKYAPYNMGQVDNEPIIEQDFYTYVEDFSSLAASGTDSGNVQVQADSDFALQKLSYFADIAGAAQTADSRVVPLITLQIIDTGSGRNLFESAVMIPAIFGTGELPFVLPTPRVFAARSTITLNVANVSASTTYNLRLNLIGYKIFRPGL